MKVGFCGLGLMGLPMARRLIDAGQEVHVWNRSVAKAEALAARGAVRQATPAAVAEAVDVVCLCLMDAAATGQVVFGADGIAHAHGARWLVDHSSIPPAATRAYAERLAAQSGMAWIDAPVSGGVPGAEAGTLAIMAGGSVAAVDAVRPVLAAYASRVTHMGPTGAGQATKLCNQIIVASTVAAIAEAVALAANSGLDASRLVDALSGGWADSKLLQVFVPRMTNPPAGRLGALDTMLKDLDAVVSYAAESGSPVPVAASVQQLLRLAEARGLGDSDLPRLVDLLLRAR